MRALLFGAGGQLGRALLLSKPSDIALTALDRPACDLANAGAAAGAIRQFRPEVVINAAAYTAVDDAEANEQVAHRINAAAAAEIAEASGSIGARLLHISTDFVFDGVAGQARSPDDVTNPVNVYGASKLLGEELVTAAAPTALIVRTAWLYAAQGRNFLNTMLRLMTGGNIVKVVDDQIGSPTAAGSLAEALWKLSGTEAAGVLHYTDSGVASWFDFAVAIGEEAEALGLVPKIPDVVPISSDGYRTPARRPKFSVLEKSATWRVLESVAPHWRVNLRRILQEKARG